MLEHGSNYRPYDCSQCSKKFFFRAELDNHLIDHENGRIATASPGTDDKSIAINRSTKNLMQRNESTANDGADVTRSEAQKTVADEDDEYIEVEQIGENSGVEAMADGDDNTDGDDKRPDRPKSYHEDTDHSEPKHI